MATATLELDSAVIQILRTKATAQGLSPEALLRKLLESENGVNDHSQTSYAKSEQPTLTPYQIAQAKGLLGAVDSSVPNPDSPPIDTEFGRHLLAEYEKQLDELVKPH
jgi:hypothetical protein